MAPTLKKLRWMQKYLVERHEIAFFFFLPANEVKHW